MTQVYGASLGDGTQHKHNTSLHKVLRQFRAKTIQLGLIVKMSSAAGISPHQSGNWFPLHSILITFLLFDFLAAQARADQQDFATFYNGQCVNRIY